MTHDELCGLSQPCDDEVPEHGYCSRQQGEFCIHCMTWCICPQLRQARKQGADDYERGQADMLAKCIATIEERIPLVADNGSWESSIAAAWLRAAVTDLQRLEKTI